MEIHHVPDVTRFNTARGQETLHPLVTVLDQSLSMPVPAVQYKSSIYIVFLKDTRCESYHYGRNQYDYQGESVVFVAPGQTYGLVAEPGTMIQPRGWVLAFHPSFLQGTSLGRRMSEFGFFRYRANEALHISDRERQLVLECFTKIREELIHAIDKHTRSLVISNIELLFNYCLRFYDRQFVTREPVNRDILTRFDNLLKSYFESELPNQIGIPTVAYCADQLNLSPNYFGDLVRKETGTSALDYIQDKVIGLAKERMTDPSRSISEIAYSMGYRYPQHFTRLFKQRVGVPPQQYRETHG